MKNRGFTLIELIIVIVITAIIASTGIPVLISLARSMQYTIQRKDLSESADVCLRRMDREIRRLRDITSVLTANSTIYSFIDIDNNTITYSLSGTTLQRTFNGTPNILADNVTGLTFTYYDDFNNVITSPIVSPNQTNIKIVQIDLRFNRDNNTIYYRTQIRLMRIKHFSFLFT